MFFTDHYTHYKQCHCVTQNKFYYFRYRGPNPTQPNPWVNPTRGQSGPRLDPANPRQYRRLSGSVAGGRRRSGE